MEKERDYLELIQNKIHEEADKTAALTQVHKLMREHKEVAQALKLLSDTNIVFLY